MIRTLLHASLAAAAFAASVPAQGVYEIDSAHSSAQFSVRHLMISNVKGEFSKVAGTFSYDPKNPAASTIEAVIDVSTINTRDAKRDAHLKNADFFDAATHPAMTFKSKQAWKSGDRIHVKGDLTMRGVTKEVTLQVDGPTPEIKDMGGRGRVGATATARINRKDWGVNWNRALEAGGVVVGEEVTITIDVEGVRKAAKAQSN